MSKDTIILTTKDFTILEAMHDNPRVRQDLLLPLIRQKLAAAIVVFREDLPQGVASINSRVSFRVDNGPSDTRILSTGQLNAPVGMALPITTRRGMALLGLTEGQEVLLTSGEGLEERIMLEKVDYQPEAARRERQAPDSDVSLGQKKPLLRIVAGGRGSTGRPAATAGGSHDDPGPSAA